LIGPLSTLGAFGRNLFWLENILEEFFGLLSHSFSKVAYT